MLFSKKEYKEMFLSFRLDGNAEDISFGGISIEVFTDFFDAPKYCYATYALKNPAMYENGECEELRRRLSDCEEKDIGIVFKLKNSRLIDFKIDLENLARRCGDERLKDMELLGWGINDKSIKDLFTTT